MLRVGLVMLQIQKNESTIYSMKESNNQPFKALGDRLKFLREQWHQSIREVSGTLEIDEKTLKSIEAGKVLPENEQLDMLINHFLLTEDQADDLRELAEFGGPKPEGMIPAGIEDILTKQIIMYLPIDNKVVYTDGMHANVNDHGVILQFMQQLPNTSQPAVVSRVGMSREHAERIIHVLQQTLEQYDANKKQKYLPSSESDSDKSE